MDYNKNHINPITHLMLTLIQDIIIIKVIQTQKDPALDYQLHLGRVGKYSFIFIIVIYNYS